jgi:hypothetical protein
MPQEKSPAAGAWISAACPVGEKLDFVDFGGFGFSRHEIHSQEARIKKSGKGRNSWGNIIESPKNVEWANPFEVPEGFLKG